MSTLAGSDFRIEANDGTVWVPDLGTDIIQAHASFGGKALKYTTADGQTIDRATSTRNGLKLISHDRQTGKVTMEISVVPTDPPIVVTGVLKTSGIGVMQSWYYSGFDAADDRKRALKDLSAAEVNLTSASAELQRSKTQVDMDQRRVDRSFQQMTEQSVKVRGDQQGQLQALKLKTAQQYLAMQANLQNMQSMQANYLNAFGGFVSDPFSQALLNIKA